MRFNFDLEKILQHIKTYWENIDKEKAQQILIGIIAGFVAIGMVSRLLSPSLKHFCRWVLERESKEDAFQLQAVPVDVNECKAETIYRRLYAIGEVKAKSAVTFKCELPGGGRIKSLPLQEGETVNEGDTLIEFEDAEAQGRYQRTVGPRVKAEADFERAEKLFEKQSISQSEFDKAKGEFERAKGEEAEAKAQLDKTVLKAPFSGVVGIVENYRVGEVVKPDAQLVTIVDDQTIHVYVPIASKSYNEISKDQDVILKVEAYPDIEFKGKVTAIDSVINKETRTILLRAEVDNSDQRLKDGMMGDVQVITGVETDAFKVPEAAIVSVGEENFVFIVERGKAVKKKVLKSFAIGKDRVIDEGLKAGQFIINVASLRIFEGCPVKIKSIDSLSEEEWMKKQEAKKKKRKKEGAR